MVSISRAPAALSFLQPSGTARVDRHIVRGNNRTVERRWIVCSLPRGIDFIEWNARAWAEEGGYANLTGRLSESPN